MAVAYSGLSAPIVRAEVALASDGDVEPVVGSFAEGGMAFAIQPDGTAMLVAVGSDAAPEEAASPLEGDGLKASAPGEESDGIPAGQAEGEPAAVAEPDASEGAAAAVDPTDGSAAAGDGASTLSIPASVEHGGVAYEVSAIGAHALSLCGADEVAIPASVSSIDEDALWPTSAQRIEVDAANPAYASYDGILYDASLSRLLSIPGGRQGAVRISNQAEEVEASAFSHSAGVDAVSVDAGGAALASWDGLLYTADGATLLRVPSGAISITIREGCTAVAPGALEGCSLLEGIEAPATLATVDRDAFGAEGASTCSAAARLLSVSGDVKLVAMEEEADALDVLPPVAASQSATAYTASANFLRWGASACYRRISYDSGTTWSSWELKSSLGGWGDESGQKYTSYRFYSGHFWLRATYNGTASALRSRWGSSSSAGTWDHCKVNQVGKSGPWIVLSDTSTYTSLTSSADLYVVFWNDNGLNMVNVTLDKQGGSGGTDSPIYLEPPAPATLPTITKPTLSGWTFSGYTDDFTTAPYLYVTSTGAPTTRTIDTATKTLKANWTKTVTFSASGGTLGSLKKLTALRGYALGRTVTAVDSTSPDYPIRSLFQTPIKVDANWAPTRTGYTFQGFWDTSASSGGTQWIAADGTLQVATCSDSTPSTLYARWTPNTYTVTLDRQSGTGGTSSVTATYLSAMPAITVPTRTAYTFAGYWSGKNGTGTQYYDSNGKSARTWNLAGNTTLYAYWIGGSIALTWDANGGEGTQVTTQAYADGAKLELPANPKRSGWTFAGWFTASSGGTQVSADTALPAAATTYYAHWVQTGPTPTFYADHDVWRAIDWTLSSPSTTDRFDSPYVGLLRAATLTFLSGRVDMAGVTTLEPIQQATYHVAATQALNGIESVWVVRKEASGERIGYALVPGSATSLVGASAVSVYLDGCGASTVTWDAQEGVADRELDEGVMPYAEVTAPGAQRFGYVLAGWASEPDGEVVVRAGEALQVPTASNPVYYARWTLITNVELPITAAASVGFELGVPDGSIRVAGTEDNPVERAEGWVRSKMPIEVRLDSISCEPAGDAASAGADAERFWAENAGYADVSVQPAGSAASAMVLSAGDSVVEAAIPSWFTIPAATSETDLGELRLLYGLSLDRLFADPSDGGAGVDIASLLPEGDGASFGIPTGLLRLVLTVDVSKYAS